MAKIDFGGVVEEVITSEEFPVEKAREVLEDEKVAVIGYGVQGPGQALNMRDNGFPSSSVSVKKSLFTGTRRFRMDLCRARPFFRLKRRQREEPSSSSALRRRPDGSVAESEACLKEGDALYFSHGFSIVYKKQTEVIPPKNIDVILVAPKGSGRSVRTNFLDGSGINSSFAVFQDFTGRAKERTVALGIAIGSGYLFPTTFEKEVYSDLTGERGVLMGCLAGVMEAQYDLLRKKGHSPSEAFNETVEELTQSLIRLVGENGMDWMYANCSTTAQRGALDWKKKFRDAVAPVFRELYTRVKQGKETEIVLKANSALDYREKLEKELSAMRNSEMWRAGAAVRSLRPENRKK